MQALEGSENCPEWLSCWGEQQACPVESGFRGRQGSGNPTFLRKGGVSQQQCGLPSVQNRRKFNDFVCGFWLVKESVILKLKLELWHPVKKSIFAAQGWNRKWDLLLVHLQRRDAGLYRYTCDSIGPGRSPALSPCGSHLTFRSPKGILWPGTRGQHAGSERQNVVGASCQSVVGAQGMRVPSPFPPQVRDPGWRLY